MSDSLPDSGYDLSIRPQDDLFGHVNGGWYETVEIPEDLPGYGAFMELRLSAERQVRGLLEEAQSAAADGSAPAGSAAQQLGDLYASFLDEARADALGTEPIAADLEAARSVTSLSELAGLLGRLERSGAVDGVFDTAVTTDRKQSDRYLVYVSQGGIGLPDEAYYREEQFVPIRAAYVDHIARTLSLVGVDDAEGAAERVMALETQLASGHWEAVESRDAVKTYNLRTRAEFAEALPGFDVDAWADGLGAPAGSLDEVVVRQPSYLDTLSAALREVPLVDWQAWLAWEIARDASPYLSADLVEEHFDFYGRTLSGTPTQRERWKRAVSLVDGALGEAVGEQYVARHFPPAAKAQMDALVGHLIEAYRQSIQTLDWMSPATRERALEKLAAFRPKIGYPPRWRDYSSIRVDRADLLGNVRRASAYETDRQLGKIGQPVDRDEWLMTPQTVNAYYSPGTNEITFPAAILQPPFFDPDADPAVNFGGIGAVIGHEIGHGFDDQGSRYDGEGNLNDWWTDDDRAGFQSRADRLIAQYDALESRGLPGHTVNGGLTVGENIGDLGGLAIALQAYRISLGGEELPEIDGLSGPQRALLNWSLVWRGKYREETARQLLTVDPHSPPDLRANIVRNLDEFHAAFATQPGDGLWLEPEERVRIW